MNRFLNLASLILLAGWAISFIVFRIGNAAHPLLAFSMIIALLKLVRAGFSAR